MVRMGAKTSTGYVLDVVKDIVNSEQIWVHVSVFIMNEICMSSRITW
jgi:hypothetical protein